jgi:hypothetical protein
MNGHVILLMFGRRIGWSGARKPGFRTLDKISSAELVSEMAKTVAPSTRETAFSCPHSCALTTQYWRSAKVEFRKNENNPPLRVDDPEERKRLLKADLPEGEYQGLDDYIDKIASGLPSIGDRYTSYSQELVNVDVSECYNCSKLALWIGDSMVWPRPSGAPPANPDFPEDIAADYYEAGQIVDASPRGAAAILRLAIQKLCVHLGEPGKNINDDIASLVKKGLDPRVQKMLDVVRITGNNAVHPGEIDLRDNRDLAEKLFGFLNIVADITISQPKAIDAVYGEMPEGALAQISRRDGTDSGAE